LKRHNTPAAARRGETKTARLTRELAEALQQQEVPPAYRLHVRDYFEAIRPDAKK